MHFLAVFMVILLLAISLIHPTKIASADTAEIVGYPAPAIELRYLPDDAFAKVASQTGYPFNSATTDPYLLLINASPSSGHDYRSGKILVDLPFEPAAPVQLFPNPEDATRPNTHAVDIGQLLDLAAKGVSPLVGAPSIPAIPGSSWTKEWQTLTTDIVVAHDRTSPQTFGWVLGRNLFKHTKFAALLIVPDKVGEFTIQVKLTCEYKPGGFLKLVRPKRACNETLSEFHFGRIYQWDHSEWALGGEPGNVDINPPFDPKYKDVVNCGKINRFIFYQDEDGTGLAVEHTPTGNLGAEKIVYGHEIRHAIPQTFRVPDDYIINSVKVMAKDKKFTNESKIVGFRFDCINSVACQADTSKHLSGPSSTRLGEKGTREIILEPKSMPAEWELFAIRGTSSNYIHDIMAVFRQSFIVRGDGGPCFGGASD